MHKLNASQIRSGLCMKVLDFVMLHIFISQFSTLGLWEQKAGILNIQYFFFDCKHNGTLQDKSNIYSK